MEKGLRFKEIQKLLTGVKNRRVAFQVRNLWIKLRTEKIALLGGQSFVEFALLLPVILIILLGMIEVVFFVDRYLDALDLTREAARFSSLRDPFAASEDLDCSTPNKFDFYYDTICLFSPPSNSAFCTDSAFCNGVNSDFILDSTRDDVLVSVYTVTDNAVTNVWPSPDGYWAWSDHDSDTTNNANWTRNCQGDTVRTVPEYSKEDVEAKLQAGAPPKRGFVAVEAYYCHEQVLGLPIISQFILNSVQIHVYSVMSLPAAQPTATPRP